jgi:hypothetical protein
MTTKWRRFAEQLVGAVGPGGIERSTLGTAINVSSNGTGTVPASDLERIVFKRFQDMKPVGPPRGHDHPPSESEAE